MLSSEKLIQRSRPPIATLYRVAHQGVQGNLSRVYRIITQGVQGSNNWLEINT